MSTHFPTLQQIRLAGLEALARELGPTGMVRFLQQFDMGYGNYSTDRHQWLDEPSVSTLAEKIQQARSPK